MRLRVLRKGGEKDFNQQPSDPPAGVQYDGDNKNQIGCTISQTHGDSGTDVDIYLERFQNGKRTTKQTAKINAKIAPRFMHLQTVFRPQEL